MPSSEIATREVDKEIISTGVKKVSGAVGRDSGTSIFRGAKGSAQKAVSEETRVLESKELAENTAKDSLKQAQKKQQDLLESGTATPEQKEAAEQAVKAAQADLDRATAAVERQEAILKSARGELQDVFKSQKKSITNALEKDPTAAAEKSSWYKSPTNVVIACFIGYEVLTATQMQEEDECYNKCTHKDSTKNDEPYANCPPPSNSPWSDNMNLFGQRHPTDKCKTFCDKDTGGCSQKNRIAAAQKSVRDNPLGAAAGALGKAVNGPMQAWDTLKNFVYIFGGIIALVIFYKVIKGFTSNVGESAAAYGKDKATNLFNSGKSGSSGNSGKN
tara:strand:+ start:1953 stop:2948 length:996 start_codon:yes stop_codon:yes gene_type:complete